MDGSDKIRTWWPRSNFQKRNHDMESTIVTDKSLCTGKKPIRLHGLFFECWCMSRIILRLQQQTWFLKF